MPRILKCEYCGTEFECKKNYNKRKYCSRKCSSQAVKVVHKRICGTCNKEIEVKTNQLKEVNYCSRKCADIANGKRVKGKRLKEYIKFTCKNCGKEVEVLPCRYIRNGKPREFCGRACAKQYDSKTHISEAKLIHCDNCGKEMYRTESHIKKRNYCSVECMGQHYSKEGLFTGENSGTWNGGKKTYYGKNWRQQRRKARERDNYTCQKCGITEEEYGQELSVHHITPFIFFDNYLKANRLENLISVCEPCHRKIHSGENHPSKFFRE